MKLDKLEMVTLRGRAGWGGPDPLDFPQKFWLKNLDVPLAVTLKARAVKLSFLCSQNW